MSISPFLSINQPCDEVLQWATKQLSEAGLRPVQTFDLHSARLALPDCSCPNHGTNECDCQMVVMLVYGKVEEPLTLILHGNDGHTWVSVADDPRQQAHANFLQAIRQALDLKVPEPNAL